MPKTLRVLALPGDGIGPDVTVEALRVLEAAATLGGVQVQIEQAPIGGVAIDQLGSPGPPDTLAAARAADAVLLGAVGGPAWDHLPSADRPERGLLALRKALGVYANLRPARFFPALAGASPLRPELTEGADIVVVRELLGGIYFGEPRGLDGRRGFNTLVYGADEIERIGRVAFELARTRSGRLTSVDKANVLESMALWRQTMTELAADYPDVELDHLYVDACAMALVTRPRSFDVLVAGNLFGDIISDEAAALTGSLGMLPSASLGDGPGLFEPVHGSAPDIAGKGVANPLATILSVAMLLHHSAGRPDLARAVEAAVDRTLADGFRTGDIADAHAPPGQEIPVGTKAMADAVLARLELRP